MDQVVHLVPARQRLGEQPVRVQLVQDLDGVVIRQADQGGRGVRVDVRAGMQAQVHEEPLLGHRQILIGQLERRGDSAVLSTDRQQLSLVSAIRYAMSQDWCRANRPASSVIASGR